MRSSRDFKASLRSAVSGLLRLSREAHKIPAFPARAPQTLRNAIPLRGTQGGGEFTLTLIFLRRSRKKASCPAHTPPGTQLCSLAEAVALAGEGLRRALALTLTFVPKVFHARVARGDMVIVLENVAWHQQNR